MEAAVKTVQAISDAMLMQAMSDGRRLFAEATKNGETVEQQRLEWNYNIQMAEATRRGLI